MELLNKNLFKCILLLFLFTSCGKGNIQLVDEPEPSALKTNIYTFDQSQIKTDEKFSILGYSYDVTKEYLASTSYKKPVIDVQKLDAALKTSIVINPESGSLNNFYAGINANEYLLDITNKSGVKSKLELSNPKQLLFTGSITENKALKDNKHESNDVGLASTDIVRYIKSYRIEETPTTIQQYVTAAFLKDLETLSPDKFVETYGTHVLTNISIGGKLRVLYKNNVIKNSDSANKLKDLNEQFRGLLETAKIDLFVATKSKSESLIHRENYDEEFYFISDRDAGIGMDYNKELKTNIPNLQKLEWEKSITNANATLADVDWEKTYPIYDFIPQSHQKYTQAIKEAVIKYIETKKL
ncbi:MAC/perforin domain-containing protein [Sphingobacterium lactis]|uniref:MAC/perforin domain-containing protein n=1 Tax=Sphingobacterium lactis TaxID=797291 RepID=UPI003F7E028F